MSRRRRAERRQVPPDPRYGSIEVSRFINKIIMRGKKTTAQRIVYGAMEMAQEESRRDALEIFQQALRNATPLVEVKPRRVGGATYQIPTEVRPGRGEALGHRLDYTGGPGSQRHANGQTACSRVHGRLPGRRRGREAQGRLATAWLKPTAPSCIIDGKSYFESGRESLLSCPVLFL